MGARREGLAEVGEEGRRGWSGGEEGEGGALDGSWRH